MRAISGSTPGLNGTKRAASTMSGSRTRCGSRRCSRSVAVRTRRRASSPRYTPVAHHGSSDRATTPAAARPLAAASSAVRQPIGRRCASSGGHVLASRSASAPPTAKAPTDGDDRRIHSLARPPVARRTGRCTAAPPSYGSRRPRHSPIVRPRPARPGMRPAKAGVSAGTRPATIREETQRGQ